MMTPKVKAALSLGTLVLASAWTTHAAVLVAYDFNGLTDLPATASTNLLSAGTFTEGAGSAFNVATNNTQEAMRFVYNASANTDEATAVAANAYVEFTINPASSFSLSTINWEHWNDFASAARTFTWFIRSSANGFATTLDSQSQVALTYVSKANLDLDVSALGTVASPVTFRLYTYDNSGSGGQVFIDNVTLNGAAVPEPGTSTLLACGTCLWGVVRRRKHRSSSN